MPVSWLDRLAGDLADATELAVAVGILLAVFDHLPADHTGALEMRRPWRSCSGCAAVLRAAAVASLLDVERHLADQRPVDIGQVGRDQRRLAAVAAEQLDHRDSLVAAGRRAQRVNKLDAARDGGGEADAVVGAEDIVVHRLGDSDHAQALAVQPHRERERVVAADRHQRVDAQVLQHSQDVRRAVDRFAALPRRCEAGQELRQSVRR